ncbi:MAG TPA: CHRD domain-containing protein, partial [Thermoanaerobaculia bacterium]|nr:CHRD domain-containing protein [Thermoanaerobaculia bacterium]
RLAVFAFSILVLTLPLQAETLSAVLTAAHEVPPTTTSGFGTATVTVDSTRTNVSVVVRVANLGTAITGAHIHKSPFGTNGNIVLNFIQGSTNFSNGVLSGSFTVPADLGADLVANPSAYYVNVHTTEFPGGAIRGQLANASGVIMFGTELRGSNEVPPTTDTHVGASLVWFDAAKSTMFFDIDSGNVTSPTAAHIHKAAAGANGNIVVNFAAFATFANGEMKGSIAISDTALVADIIANPQNYYVNVHTTANPGGAIRGQLAAVNEYDIAVAGKVTGALNTNFVTDVRVFNPSYTFNAVALLEYFSGPSNTNATSMIALDIPARNTAVLNDIGGSSGFNLSGTGGIRVTSASQLAVTSRIFNDLRPVDGGTYGQFVPGLKRASLLQNGALLQLSNSAIPPVGFRVGFRTNVGYFNPNPNDATARFELRDAAGNVLGTATTTIGPLSQTQLGIGVLFPGIDLSSRPDLTVTYASSTPISAYASVVDNTTSDQYFVVPQEDPASLTNQQ